MPVEQRHLDLAFAVRTGQVPFKDVPEAERAAVASIMGRLSDARMQEIAESRQFRRHRTGAGAAHHNRVG